MGHHGEKFACISQYMEMFMLSPHKLGLSICPKNRVSFRLYLLSTAGLLKS